MLILDNRDNKWDFEKKKNGIMMNSVKYQSPIFAHHFL